MFSTMHICTYMMHHVELTYPPIDHSWQQNPFILIKQISFIYLSIYIHTCFSSYIYTSLYFCASGIDWCTRIHPSPQSG